LPPCKGGWHPKCYREHPGDPFPRMTLGEDADDDLYSTKAEQEKRKDRHRVARSGDCLMCSFQCDSCHFQNIQGRSPTPTEESGPLMVAIRRANLDAFWAREPGTVEQNQAQLGQAEKGARDLGITYPFKEYPKGPFPVRDSWGMTEATLFLNRSRAPGKNAEFLQFGTTRKLRSMFSNLYGTTPAGVEALSAMGDGKALQLFSDAPTNSVWHRRFIEGSHRRMGDRTHQDRAISISELLKLVEIWEEEWEEAEGKGDTNRCLHVARIAFAAVIGFAGGFRGEEIVKAEIEPTLKMRKHERKTGASFCTVALRARVKGERCERYHLLPMTLVSASGLPIARWLDRLLGVFEKLAITEGPMLRVTRNKRPVRARIADLDDILHYYLRIVQKRWPGILPGDVEIELEHSFARTFRRGSTAQARLQEIPQDVIDANNRWRMIERAGEKNASMGMRELYSDAALMAPVITKYSGGL
jgi:hypothetical protein